MLPVADQVRNALIQNENSGTYSQVAKLSLANSRSGYSVGEFQFDFYAHRNNKVALANFSDVLVRTSEQTGLSISDISNIMSSITSQGGSPVIERYRSQIEKALQTPSGWSFITAVDASSLDTAVRVVTSLIGNANTAHPTGAGGLTAGSLNPIMVAELAEYVNQFGPSVTELNAFLTGGQAHIGDGSQTTTQSNGALDLNDLNTNFFSLTTQFSQSPANYQHFLSSARIAAQASSNGTFIDLPDLVVKQTASSAQTLTDLNFNGEAIRAEAVLVTKADTSQSLASVGWSTELNSAILTVESGEALIATVAVNSSKASPNVHSTDDSQQTTPPASLIGEDNAGNVVAVTGSPVKEGPDNLIIDPVSSYIISGDHPTIVRFDGGAFELSNLAQFYGLSFLDPSSVPSDSGEGSGGISESPFRIASATRHSA